MNQEPKITIILPRVLSIMTGGQREFSATGSSVMEVLQNLAIKTTPLRGHLFDETGRLRRHIICIHEGTHVKAHEVDCRSVHSGDTIRIVNSIAGG